MPAPTFLELARSIDNGLSGNVRWPVRFLLTSGVHIISNNDVQIVCDCTAGFIDVGLPDAVANRGMPFLIKKVDNTVNPGVYVYCVVAGQKIDGEDYQELLNQNDFLVVYSDGVGYKIFATDGGLKKWTEDSDGNIIPDDPFGGQSIGSADSLVADVFALGFQVYSGPGDPYAAASLGPGSLRFGNGNDPQSFALELDSPGVALVPTGSKMQQTDLPTVNADLANKQYVDALGGTMQLIQRIDVVGSTVSDVTFSGLNGDADGTYVIIGSVKNALASDVDLKLQPNGADTSMDGSAYGFSGGGSGVSNKPGIGFLGTVLASGFNFFRAFFKGTKAGGLKRSGFSDNTNQGAIRQMCALSYNDGTTQITSLKIVGVTGSAIAVGSYFSLYKMPNG